MRSLILAGATLLVVALAPSAVWAKNCPANATKASFAVWPPNSIATGYTATGKHPCGRRLACTGGDTGRTASRRCHWL
jgi:hypothetical protein